MVFDLSCDHSQLLACVQSTGDDAIKHYKPMIEDLVEQYIQKERTIIVAAIQCTDDFNNQVGPRVSC
jgi:hypothetical protein